MPYASGAFKGECNVSQKAVVSSSIMKSGGMKAVLMRSLVKGRTAGVERGQVSTCMPEKGTGASAS
jgi:hypothetical protein